MASMPSRSVRDISQKYRQCAGVLSRVAQTTGLSVLENCEGWQPKNCVSVKAKRRGWHPKIDSVSWRSVKGGSHKWNRCAGNVRGLHPKKGVSVLEKGPGWKPKNGVHLQTKYRGWQKISSVSSGSCQGGNQKWRICAGELSSVAHITCHRILENCEG